MNKRVTGEAWRWGGLSFRQLVRNVVKHIKADHITDLSAQLSYYFFFAVFPLLLFLTALLGLFVEPGTFLNKAISNYLGAIVPHSASNFIQTALVQISKGTSAGKVSVGLVVALWSGSSGMSAIIKSLNIAYNIKEPRPWWKEKLLSIWLTVAVTLLIMGAMALVTYGGDMGQAFATRHGYKMEFAETWRIGQWFLLLAFVLAAFSMVYYFGPNFHHSNWSWLMPGTVVGVVLWLAISFGFRYYVHYFTHYNATYGSIGAIIVLLLWFYLSGIAILVGGEVNSAIEHALEDDKVLQEQRQQEQVA